MRNHRGHMSITPDTVHGPTSHLNHKLLNIYIPYYPFYFNFCIHKYLILVSDLNESYVDIFYFIL